MGSRDISFGGVHLEGEGRADSNGIYGVPSECLSVLLRSAIRTSTPHRLVTSLSTSRAGQAADNTPPRKSWVARSCPVSVVGAIECMAYFFVRTCEKSVQYDSRR
ncbi:protein of unknown function (plasmid) [Ralstonia solanacearum PSI07]|nr:protein of unknown function [Ralstonia solanacearum PSI07]